LAASGGGTKTTIWSVDDGITGDDNPLVTVKPAFSTYDTDLLYKDLTGATWQVGGDTSENGAHVWIGTDNKIHYDASNLSSQIQALAEGESWTDTVSYTIRMSNGTLSVGKLAVVITGTNDGPVAIADTNTSDPITEAGVNPGNTPFAGDPGATGNVLDNDTDVDAGAALSVAAINGDSTKVGVAVAGTYGSVTINGNGSYTYTLDNADTDTNALAQGAIVTDVFSYTVTDEHGATSIANLTITITGTNDGPVAVDVSTSADEDGAAVTAAFSADDVDSDDDGASLTYAIVDDLGAGEGSVVNNNDGTFTFDPGTDFQDLAENETREVTFTYKATDLHGADSGTQTVTEIGRAHD
jgi:VCBS repeat-containing protein